MAWMISRPLGGEARLMTSTAAPKLCLSTNPPPGRGVDVQAGRPAPYYRAMGRPATYSAWILAITLSVAAAWERPMAFSVTSTAFREGAGIPVKHTCDGADVSPPLAWSGAPAGAGASSLSSDEPDGLEVA